MIVPEENALNDYFANYGSHLMPLHGEYRRYTYGDFRNFRNWDGWQIIDGLTHFRGERSGEMEAYADRLFYALSRILAPVPGRVIREPVIPLTADGKNENLSCNVVRPDLAVVDDRVRMEGRCMYGIPLIILEMACPPNAALAFREKAELYGKCGVPRYWIVDPRNYLVHVFSSSEKGRYDAPRVYYNRERVPVLQGSGFMDLADIFHSRRC